MFQSDLELRAVLAILAIVLYVNHHHLQRKKPFPSKGKGIEFWVIVAPSLWTLSLLLYVLGFEWFKYVAPLPHWLRWVGVGLMVACLPLSRWTYKTLGDHFSRKLELRDTHKLVRGGPYRYVRHPMYSILFLCALATCLISANLFVMTSTVAVAVVMLLRIKKEETMLAERFGEEYRFYQQHTGAVLPKLIRYP